MRLALSADHKEFFLKNNYIEFEELLSPAQAEELRKNADEALASRIRISATKPGYSPAKAAFHAGYDLWRDNAAVKKAVHKKEFALLASELFQTLPLRCAFDQYLSTAQTSASPFSEGATLQESSCLTPLAGALFLVLEDLLRPLSSFPLPINAGNGLFISPSLPIPWPEIFSLPDLKMLIIGYSGKRTMFSADTRDPRAADVKMQGYVYNEFLSDAKHPILIQKH